MPAKKIKIGQIDTSEPAQKKYVFSQDCVRMRATSEGESKWQNMMQKKEEITQASFIYSCDFTGFLEEGETVEQYFADRKREDAETKFFQSMIGFQKVRFFQTCGFEFIFI